MMDDNVHMQNSVQLVDALQRANKDFEMMFYPQSRHGIGGQHYMRLQTEFIRRTMGVRSRVTRHRLGKHDRLTWLGSIASRSATPLGRGRTGA